MSIFHILFTFFGSLLFIIVGLVNVYKKDWLWKINEDMAQNKGIKIKRTAQWDRSRNFFGCAGIIFGAFGMFVVFLVLLVMFIQS